VVCRASVSTASAAMSISHSRTRVVIFWRFCWWTMRSQLSFSRSRFSSADNKQGGSKAAVAIAHNLLVIVWFVLHDDADYRDLGADWFTRHDNPDAKKPRLIRELQTLG
jgi:hypothetical protein